MRTFRRFVVQALAICLGCLGLVQASFAVSPLTSPADSGVTFLATGRTGVLTLSDTWLGAGRVEVWAFPTSGYTGTPLQGQMLMRWIPYAGGTASPEVVLAPLADGSYHLAVVGYLFDVDIDWFRPGPLVHYTCPAKQANIDNELSSNTEYCSWVLWGFANFTGSLRCSGGTCLTSTQAPGGIVPETGWWWNPAEPGRWLLIEENDGWIFLSFSAFDGNGLPVWYLTAGAVNAEGVFTATLNQYVNGQTLTGAYKLPSVVSTGNTITLRFSGSGNGQLTLPDGRTVPVERFRF